MPIQTPPLAGPMAALLALALVSQSAAQCTVDTFEPNDSCLAAADLPIGVHSDLTGSLLDNDWYRFEVPAGQSFYVEFTLLGQSDDAAAFVTLKQEDPTGIDCATNNGTLPGAYMNGSGQQSFRFRWDSPANTSRVFFIEAFFFGTEVCTDYELSLSMEPNDCLLTPDNGLEDNDSCSSPAAIVAGTLSGQRLAVADPDYYSVTAAPGELLTVVASGYPLGTRFNLLAWDPAQGCGGNVVAGGAVSHGQAETGFYLFNTGASPRTWIIHMQPLPNQLDGTGFCFDYELELRSDGGLCLPDMLEPNSDCSNPSTVGPGFYPDLNVRLGVSDHLLVNVPDGATLRATTRATTPATVRPMRLQISCDGGALAVSHFHQTSDKQVLEWTNTTGAGVDSRLFIRGTGASYPAEFCHTYSLDIEVGFGQPFCTGNLNSTGFRSRMNALGSKTVGVGETILQVNHLPTSEFGLVFFGFTAQPAATLGDGKLCIAAPLMRLAPGSTGSGIMETRIDWANPGAASAILSGQRAYFQAWFRDPSAGAAGSNTSGTLAVQFQ